MFTHSFGMNASIYIYIYFCLNGLVIMILSRKLKHQIKKEENEKKKDENQLTFIDFLQNNFNSARYITHVFLNFYDMRLYF